MKKSNNALGGLLVTEGSLTEEQLSDVLEQQRLGLPFASLCHLLGYVDESALVRALSRQMGVPGVVLGECIIALQNLRDVPVDIARKYVMLPLYEDKYLIFVAISDLADPGVVHELGIIKGKSVVPHVAVHSCLLRTIRDCYRLLDQGDAYWFGSETSFEMLNDAGGVLSSVSDLDELPEAVEPAPLDVTDPNMPMPVEPEDILESESLSSLSGVARLGYVAPQADPEEEDLDLDARASLPTSRRILVVEPDEKSSHLLTEVLEQEGHAVVCCDSGIEAVRLLRQDPPELAIIEVMLPKIQGYQLCRSIKSSTRYGHIPVILMTRAEAGNLPGRKMLEKYGADELLTKPFNQSELLGVVNQLLSGAQGPKPAQAADAGLFEEAIAQYRDGQALEAVETLRRALEMDPLSARYHFVLGNILQHLEQYYDAIDAYESTVSLRSDYFPALSRLAFLYYKQGFLKRALETWNQSLEHCSDEDQAARILKFKDKLAAELENRRAQ
jgi:DNA-binding response OmpR family regulator